MATTMDPARPLASTVRRVMVAAPRDYQEEADRVAAVLRRKAPALEVMTSAVVAAQLPQGPDWRARWGEAWRAALVGVNDLVVVPRTDGTIGSGVLTDLRAAQSMGLRVVVVSPAGRLLPLDQVRMDVTKRPNGRRPLAERQGWRTRAARFRFEV